MRPYNGGYYYFSNSLVHVWHQAINWTIAVYVMELVDLT